MTFTNKAAAEMVGALKDRRLSVAKPVISTFHSFCVRVLRRDVEALRSLVSNRAAARRAHQNFVIYDESDQRASSNP